MSDHVYDPGTRVWCVLDGRIREAAVLSNRCVGDRFVGYDMSITWEQTDLMCGLPVRPFAVGRALVWPTKEDALRALAMKALR